MNAELDLSQSMMMRNAPYMTAFWVPFEEIPSIWMRFAEQVFVLYWIPGAYESMAVGCSHLCHSTAIWNIKEIMLHEIYRGGTSAQASGDILEDPTELIRLKILIPLQLWWREISQTPTIKWGQCAYYVTLWGFSVHVDWMQPRRLSLVRFTSGPGWNKRADANPTGSAEH